MRVLILVLVTALFTGLAAVASVYAWWLEREQRLSNLHGEAEAVGVTVSEFLVEQGLEVFDERRGKLEQALAHTSVRSVFLPPEDDQPVRHALSAPHDYALPEGASRLHDGSHTVSGGVRHHGDEAFYTAYVSATREGGRPVIVGIELDAGSLVDARQTFAWRASAGVGVALLMGVLVSSGLVLFFNRQLGHLRQRLNARRMGEQIVDSFAPVPMVTEFAELDRAAALMDSLELAAARREWRDTVMAAQQDDPVARHQVLMPPVQWRTNQWTVWLGLVGPAEGHFHAAPVDAPTGQAALGMVADNRSACLAATWWERQLEAGPHSVDELHRLRESFHGLFGADARIRLLDLALAPDTPGGGWYFDGTMEDEAREWFTAWVRGSSAAGAGQLAAELETLASREGAAAAGAVLIARRVEAGYPGSSQ